MGHRGVWGGEGDVEIRPGQTQRALDVPVKQPVQGLAVKDLRQVSQKQVAPAGVFHPRAGLEAQGPVQHVAEDGVPASGDDLVRDRAAQDARGVGQQLPDGDALLVGREPRQEPGQGIVQGQPACGQEPQDQRRRHQDLAHAGNVEEGVDVGAGGGDDRRVPVAAPAVVEARHDGVGVEGAGGQSAVQIRLRV